MEKILAAGADPNVTTTNGETPLMAAARTGNAQAAAALLAHGADVNTREKVRGQTALMWAVSQRDPQLTALLLSHGADFRIRSESAKHLVFTGEVARAEAVGAPRVGAVGPSRP